MAVQKKVSGQGTGDPKKMQKMQNGKEKNKL